MKTSKVELRGQHNGDYKLHWRVLEGLPGQKLDFALSSCCSAMVRGDGAPVWEGDAGGAAIVRKRLMKFRRDSWLIFSYAVYSCYCLIFKGILLII